jgi:hypothetical protein
MSKHHTLPPIIHTPPPRPKKVETRKRRLSVGMLDETDEIAETDETSAIGFAAPVAIKLSPAQLPEIESAARKPQGPLVRLSQSTLTALLRAQELN